MSAFLTRSEPQVKARLRDKERHASPRKPRAKRRLHNQRALRAERMIRTVLWGALVGVEL